jgi:D-glycero-D-manno-heptose 1,7-bisphosphate phosphatase
VFLDRDGTINQDSGFVHRPEDLVLLPGAPQALAALKRAGFLLIVVTNQSGVARGHFSEVDVARFHAHMNEVLAGHGAAIDAFYYCPDLPDAFVAAYRRDSALRKPDVGMFRAACRDFSIAVAASYMVGDRLSDIEFAARAGLRAILVRTGKGAEDEPLVEASEVVIVDDLAQAARWVLDEAR